MAVIQLFAISPMLKVTSGFYHLFFLVLCQTLHLVFEKVILTDGLFGMWLICDYAVGATPTVPVCGAVVRTATSHVEPVCNGLLFYIEAGVD